MVPALHWTESPKARVRENRHAGAREARRLPRRRHRREPRGQARSGDPGQDLLQGPFHARLVVVLEFVLIADQCEGVRDAKL